MLVSVSERTEITRKLEWDAGHRVLHHEGKCKHLHGHRYVAEITVVGKQDPLDSLGRVIDFSVVKAQVGAWIDDNWDHNLMLHPDDPLLKMTVDFAKEAFAGKDPYVMQTGNPTAENIAKELFFKAAALMPASIRIVRVRVWETPNCFADYTRTEVRT